MRESERVIKTKGWEKDGWTSFWEHVRWRLMWWPFVYFFQQFFVAWLLDSGGLYHQATEPVVFIYALNTVETSKSPERLWTLAFLVCVQLKGTMALILQSSATKSNHEQHKCTHTQGTFCLPLKGWNVIWNCTVSYLIKPFAWVLCCNLSFHFTNVTFANPVHHA